MGTIVFNSKKKAKYVKTPLSNLVYCYPYNKYEYEAKSLSLIIE